MITFPDTYCIHNEDNDCKYDEDALQINRWIQISQENTASLSFCKESELTISNSFLFGTHLQVIVIGGGSLYLYNVTVQMAGMGIHAINSEIYLEIIHCNIQVIGAYYSSSWATSNLMMNIF